MTDLAYQAAGRFWAELAACGVAHVVVSPGSRSTPLAVTARHHPNLRVTVQLDERVAGFCALGMAKATGRPTALVSTSGTAAANYLPAVVEAHWSGVPLVVCTADRPPEERDAGAGQTIDQVKLYGDNVRWYAETPCDFDHPDYYARLAVRAATMAGVGPNPGPVHLNWPFRKPLEPQAALTQPTATVGRPLAPAAPLNQADIAEVVALAGRRGLIVAGALDVDDTAAAAIADFAEAAGWPVVADAGSQLRGRGPMVLSGAEWVLHSADPARGAAPSAPDTPELAPEAIVSIGGPPSNRAVIDYMASCRAPHRLLVDPRRRWEDPSFGWTKALASDPAALLGAAAPQMTPAAKSWSAGWAKAAATAWGQVEAALAESPLLEPLIAATLLRALPEQVPLYLSNSMPVRDATSFWPPNAKPRRVLVNRGANGIDGMVASALGAALALNKPVAAVVGDIALLHDIAGLAAASRSGADLCVVVPNNGGGGIFSLLPVAAEGPDVYFDELFHTPHGTNLADLANGLGVNHRLVNTPEDLADAVADATHQAAGVTVVEVPIDHQAALAQRTLLAGLASPASPAN